MRRTIFTLKSLLLLCLLTFATGTAWAQNVIFEETFANCAGMGGNDGKFSGISGQKEISDELTDNPGWTVEKANAASACVSVGQSKNAGSVTTPALTKLNGNATLTFKAAAWAKDATTLTLEIVGGGTLDQETVTLEKGKFSDYTVTISGGTAATQITFKGTSKGNRFFLDDVKVVGTGSVTPSKKDAGLAWSQTSFSLEQGEAFTAPTFTQATTATVTFTSDNEAVATVDANGVISLAGGEGKATITATAEANDDFEAGTASVTITVYKKNAGLAWSETSISIEDGVDVFTAPTFTKATTATVTFASDNEAVATVDAEGHIALAGAQGTAKITATAEANDAFEAGTASVTITVFTNNVYKKVSTLTSGAQYLLVAQRDEATYYANPLSADKTYGYLSTGEITGTVDEIKVKSTYDDAFTFESMDGGYSIKDALGRYYIQQGTYKSFNTADTPAAWTVEPQENGTFKIAQNGYFMQFGQGTFTTFGVYTDAQKNAVMPLLYAHVVTIPAIATAEGYATYYTDKAFIMPEGLEGTTISYDAAANSLKMDWQYKAGTTVPAGTALLVKGTKGQSYDALVVSSDAKAPADNVLFGATKATTPEEAGKYYELTYSKEGDKAVLGFFYENENGDAFESAAGKAYLRLPEGVSAAAAKGFALEGNVTGIEGVTNATATTPAAIYSLDGRRLTAPVKGINIIGGKKVLVK